MDIWKARELLKVQNSPVKHGKEILQLLEAAQLAKELGVVHYNRHQKDDSLVEQGNSLADQTVKQAAQGVWQMALLPAHDSIEKWLPQQTKF